MSSLSLNTNHTTCPISKGIAQDGTQCKKKELNKAEAILLIHNVIEEVAYRALANIVNTLGLDKDEISATQCGQILSHVKEQAHIELFKKGGYVTDRTKILTQSQFSGIMQNVGKIVHDRDTRLTDARYYTVTDLLMGLDDHNTMVKEILLRSWYKCPSIVDPDHSHLDNIKARVNFYPMTNKTLGFDLKTTLDSRKAFFDQYFPGIRSGGAETSEAFVNITEVREYFGGSSWVKVDLAQKDPVIEYTTQYGGYQALNIGKETLDAKLASILDAGDMKALLSKRQVTNQVRKKTTEACPLLKNKDITLRQFLTLYFPEIMEKITKHQGSTKGMEDEHEESASSKSKEVG